MAASLIDLGAVDLNITGEFGNYTIRNYSEDGTSITAASIDENLYNENVGAFGDMLLNKSYKAQNIMLTIKVLRNSADYAKLKGIVSLELTGKSVLFSSLLIDNNTKEKYFSPQCVMKNNPASAWGSQPSPDVEFKILMPSVVYTAPTI